MRKPGSKCRFKGCHEEVHARELCPAHHAQWYNGGEESLRPVRPKDPVDRFWSYVTTKENPDECWGWTGVIDRGCGRIKVERRQVLAHVYSWELHKGPVPPGEEVDHYCRNRECTNPRHLRSVTRGVNQQNKGNFAGSRSQYKGVSWSKANQCWVGRVTVEGRRIHVKSSVTDEKAVALACLLYRMDAWPDPNLYDERLAEEFGVDYSKKKLSLDSAAETA